MLALKLVRVAVEHKALHHVEVSRVKKRLFDVVLHVLDAQNFAIKHVPHHVQKDPIVVLFRLAFKGFFDRVLDFIREVFLLRAVAF